MRRYGSLFSFEFSLFVSHGLGGVGEKRGAGVSLSSVTAVFVYMPADRENKRSRNLNRLRIRRSNFTDWVGGGGRGAGGSYSLKRRFWYICQQLEKQA